MKKKYIAPKIDIVCLQNSGRILFNSLDNGEVGSPTLNSDEYGLFDPVSMDEPWEMSHFPPRIAEKWGGIAKK